MSDKKKPETDPPKPPSGPPSPCFLTTAVVDAMGMTDDSEPLTMARYLRDEKMGGDRDSTSVDLYYKVAPLVVERTDQTEWESFWQHHMKPITNLIKHGEYDVAKDWYTYITAKLIDKKATRFDDETEVEAVYSYGLRGIGQSALPYGLRYGLLKVALRIEVMRRWLGLALKKRRVERIILQ